ncbi:hypothetical protein Taro_015132 [Colocasia esculenta]|uniref:Uncharacterized protein n=1 Tax=Colocasia esculenta TaxID=4460 RepID=A0A843UKK4_COLES|nr:hypothetical protein [Colocasia esculenta]
MVVRVIIIKRVMKLVKFLGDHISSTTPSNDVERDRCAHGERAGRKRVLIMACIGKLAEEEEKQCSNTSSIPHCRKGPL